MTTGTSTGFGCGSWESWESWESWGSWTAGDGADTSGRNEKVNLKKKTVGGKKNKICFKWTGTWQSGGDVGSGEGLQHAVGHGDVQGDFAGLWRQLQGRLALGWSVHLLRPAGLRLGQGLDRSLLLTHWRSHRWSDRWSLL